MQNIHCEDVSFHFKEGALSQVWKKKILVEGDKDLPTVSHLFRNKHTIFFYRPDASRV